MLSLQLALLATVLFIWPENAYGLRPTTDSVEVSYDRFTDSTTVKASTRLPFPSSRGRPDSVSFTVGITVPGRSLPSQRGRPYISGMLTRHTSSTIPLLDSTEILRFLIDGTKRFALKPRLYSFHDLTMVNQVVEIVSYRLSAAQFQLLARARSVEARFGYSEPLANASELTAAAAAVVRRINR
jgi:hypothetical protein